MGINKYTWKSFRLNRQRDILFFPQLRFFRLSITTWVLFKFYLRTRVFVFLSQLLDLRIKPLRACIKLKRIPSWVIFSLFCVARLSLIERDNKYQPQTHTQTSKSQKSPNVFFPVISFCDAVKKFIGFCGKEKKLCLFCWLFFSFKLKHVRKKMENREPKRHERQYVMWWIIDGMGRKWTQEGFLSSK